MSERDDDPGRQSTASAWTRLWRGLGNETVVAVLIVFVTIFGAWVTWRAAAASGTASDLDQQGRQGRILANRASTELERELSYEESLFQSYEAHVLLADRLERDAAEFQGRRARQLRARGDVARAQARGLQALFGLGFHLDRSDRPAYNRAATRRFQEQNGLGGDPRQPHELEKAAGSAREKRFWLVVVDMAAIAAVFFLTIALLGARPRPGIDDEVERPTADRRLALAGSALFALAAVSFVAVAILVKVPTA